MISVLDVGTTGCRTTLFDDLGVIKSVAHREYHNIYLSSLDIEQNPVVWRESLFETMRECIRDVYVDIDYLEAAIVTSQRATIIPVDGEGSPLRNAILWLDKRGLEECELISSSLGLDTVYEKTGLRIDPYFSAPKILWIKDHQPKIYHDTFKFLTVHDYIIHSLTGEMVTDQTQASRTMLFNIDRCQWDDEIFNTLNIERDKVPKVKLTGTRVGELSSEIAVRTGFPKGTPVFVGGGDQQMAAIGLGVVNEERLGVTTGGGSFVVAHSNSSIRDTKMRVLCSASAIPGKWILEAGVFTTGSVYKWFKDNFGQVETILSEELKRRPYEILDMEAEAEDQDRPSGLIVIPHFAGSAAPHWNPLAKGVIFNLTLHTTRKSLINAILESICLEIKKNIIVIEKVIGKNVEEVYTGGGASRSELFNRIQADVYGKTVLKVGNTEAASLGAAMVALTQLGRYKDLDEALNMVKVQSKTDPNHDRTRKYETILEVSESIYNALQEKGVYERAFRTLED